MHLDQESVQRLLHGELPAPMLAPVREHLGGCDDCRILVTEATREEDAVFAALLHLDHPLPRLNAEQVAARARGRRSGWGRWAALILLALGAAGAAYAAPGSPVRGWVRALVNTIRLRSGPPSSTPLPAAVPAPAPAGVALAPGPHTIILFQRSSPHGQARVLLTDGSELVVRAPSGAATFAVEPNRLVIENPGDSTVFQIQIPRSAPRIEIRVAGHTIFLKSGPSITTATPPGAGDTYVLPLAPPRT